jgi:hypothetical protein
MESYGGANARRVAYLSAEYLPGPHLANNLLNLGITDATRQAVKSLGYDFDEIVAQEEEPVSATADLAASHPVTWIRSLRSKYRPSATASVTSSAFLIR